MLGVHRQKSTHWFSDGGESLPIFEARPVDADHAGTQPSIWVVGIDEVLSVGIGSHGHAIGVQKDGGSDFRDVGYGPAVLVEACGFTKGVLKRIEGHLITWPTWSARGPATRSRP